MQFSQSDLKWLRHSVAGTIDTYKTALQHVGRIEECKVLIEKDIEELKTLAKKIEEGIND